MGCNAVLSGEGKSTLRKKYLLHPGFFNGLFFYLEHGGDIRPKSRITLCKIPEEKILQSSSCKNLKSNDILSIFPLARDMNQP
jgi:hypothetical protein